MAAPPTPAEVDGVSVTGPAKAMLAKLINVCWAPDPLRPAAAVLDQALRAFRKMHQLVSGSWIRRPIVILGGEEQAGAILRFPSGSDD